MEKRPGRVFVPRTIASKSDLLDGVASLVRTWVASNEDVAGDLNHFRKIASGNFLFIAPLLPRLTSLMLSPALYAPG